MGRRSEGQRRQCAFARFAGSSSTTISSGLAPLAGCLYFSCCYCYRYRRLSMLLLLALCLAQFSSSRWLASHASSLLRTTARQVTYVNYKRSLPRGKRGRTGDSARSFARRSVPSLSPCRCRRPFRRQRGLGLMERGANSASSGQWELVGPSWHQQEWHHHLNASLDSRKISGRRSHRENRRSLHVRSVVSRRSNW